MYDKFNAIDELVYFSGKDDSLKIVKEIVSSGTDVNAHDRYNRTPLFSAVRSNCTKNALYLIEVGADVSIADRGVGLVEIAAENDNFDIMQMLLTHGGAPNGFLGDGSPLRYAIRHRNSKMVFALLASGADPNAREEKEIFSYRQLEPRTALYECMAWPDTPFDIYKALIDAGANLFAPHEYRKTPMTLILRRGLDSPYFQYLLKARPEIQMAQSGVLYTGYVLVKDDGKASSKSNAYVILTDKDLCIVHRFTEIIYKNNRSNKNNTDAAVHGDRITLLYDAATEITRIEVLS